jgi:DNA-binding LacI/PurR family transcriptional regulator
LAEAGLKAEPEYERVTGFSPEAGAAPRELLALRNPPTAVFAASDTQAIGILEAAREAEAPPQRVLLPAEMVANSSTYKGCSTLADRPGRR